MQEKMSLSKVLVVLSIIFFLFALLAEITLFNTFKLTKAEIDASPDLWARIEFAYWLGAFSEGWLFSTCLISLVPSLNVGKAARVMLILLLCTALVMTISIRDVLWTL